MDVPSILITQTRRAPMDSLSDVIDYSNAVSKIVNWDEVAVLYDDGPSAVIVLLLEDEKVRAIFRFCLSAGESIQALELFLGESATTTVRNWQGHTISRRQIASIEEIEKVWIDAEGQSKKLDTSAIRELFTRIESETQEKGRGVEVSSETRRQVLLESHGRCMYEGCGKDLTIDPITGIRGNYSYLAHNVASSERGARGILYLSKMLSDDPSNILLLCDIHHRIVDTVAKADYDASRLTDMKNRFLEESARLLDSLSRPKISAYCVSWPIHSQVISVPSHLQVAQSLIPLGARLDGNLSVLTENEDTLRTANPDDVWPLMPAAITRTADRLIMQSQESSYRAALFAIGLMPSLIALGSKLGNKCEITPMLRDRQSGFWFWPSDSAEQNIIDIDGVTELDSKEEEIVLELALTARPNSMTRTAGNLNLPSITVLAKTERLGNAAIAHPQEGNKFRQEIHKLFHYLKDTCGTKTIHVLPCASNAACVFFGQAFDNYHPNLVIYDFADNGESMVPRLRISSENSECVVDYVDRS